MNSYFSLTKTFISALSMSKSSDNPKSVIRMLDTPEQIRKNIMSATTDSECIVKYDMENKPGISNLINIVVSLTGDEVSDIEERFIGKNYGEFKKYVADIVVDEITKIQEKYNELMNDTSKIDEILERGANICRDIAKNKFNDMKQRLGLYK